MATTCMYAWPVKRFSSHMQLQLYPSSKGRATLIIYAGLNHTWFNMCTQKVHGSMHSTHVHACACTYHVLKMSCYMYSHPCMYVPAQSVGVLFTVAGFVVIFLVGSYSEPNFSHAIFGIVLTVLLLQQYLSGIL